MIHYNTTNLSFLKIYHLLKEKGVKNNTFFLELLDESLEYIDPFNEDNLSDEMKERILLECAINPWYFLRECVRIPAAGLVRYDLNLGTLAFNWAVLNNFNTFMVLPRQCGKTFGAA
jgi:hypothetical protein